MNQDFLETVGEYPIKATPAKPGEWVEVSPAKDKPLRKGKIQDLVDWVTPHVGGHPPRKWAFAAESKTVGGALAIIFVWLYAWAQENVGGPAMTPEVASAISSLIVAYIATRRERRIKDETEKLYSLPTTVTPHSGEHE